MQAVAQKGLLYWFQHQPLFLLAFAAASLSMLVPAVYALSLEEFGTARAFFYTGTLGIILYLMIGTAIAGKRPRHGALGPLLSLCSVMFLLPVVFAIPFYEALRTTTFFNAYVEMVSSVTTTGASMFDGAGRLNNALHLWRAQVGWMGGFVMWTAAASILAPLNLGGFEVTASAEPGRIRVTGNAMGRTQEARTRLFRSIRVLGPIYLALTGLLWSLLFVSGEGAFVALCHAMSVMSTSGISPVGGIGGSESGLPGEAVMFLFLIFAISRVSFSTDTVATTGGGFHTDPEVRLAIVFVVTVPALLFLRHWFGAFDVSEDESVITGLRALWGGIFTVMSFLTTTGFMSADWQTAQVWSGLNTPGVILMGLAVVGGGVATTAGGIKLLRVFALYRHGVRELDQLVHPSSVSGARGLGRRLQSKGAYIAWVFFMLFTLSLAAISLALAASGVGFEQAMVLSVAGLTNTGPLLIAAAAEPIELAALSVGAKSVFTAAMVIGRIETLALIALLTPELWRA